MRCTEVNLYPFLRPFLFKISPEHAHLLTLRLLKLYGYLPSSRPLRTAVKLHGMKFYNRLGLAAGFDKDGIAIPGLQKLRFGFLELGAVTPRAQIGNPRPRLFRIPDDEALINCLGFNNEGVDALVSRIVTSRAHIDVPLGVNIGKNFDTPLANAVFDYLYCFQQLKVFVDFVTVNISSPNTPGLRSLQKVEHAKLLLDKLVAARDGVSTDSSHRVSIFVKISPDLNEQALLQLCQVIQNSGCDGIIATNTTRSRIGLTSKPMKEDGGLSGKPLFQKSLNTVRFVRECVNDDLLIIGCGGISDPQSACEMLKSGADLLQIYTALVYRGPSLIREIITAMNTLKVESE